MGVDVNYDVVNGVCDAVQSCEGVSVLGYTVFHNGIDVSYKLQISNRFQSQYILYNADYFKFDGVIFLGS